MLSADWSDGVRWDPIGSDWVPMGSDVARLGPMGSDWVISHTASADALLTYTGHDTGNISPTVRKFVRMAVILKEASMAKKLAYYLHRRCVI